jgi:hypothetical protein
MHTAYIITGTLNDDQTVTLDEALPLAANVKVRLAIEPLVNESLRKHDDVVNEIWDRQRQRGYQPAVRAEIDADLKVERDSWGE